jgi:hypothetical protein
VTEPQGATASAPSSSTPPTTADDHFEEKDERLLPDETVSFKTQKHWAAPIADSWTAVLMIIGALVLAWLQTPETNGIMGFVNRVLNLVEIVLFLGGIGWIIYNIISWRSASYLVTNHRLLGQEGLLRKKSTDTLLTSISDVRFRQSAVGRMLGYGDIQILSASGDAGSDKFTSVKNAVELKKQILQQKISASAPAMPPTSPAAGVPTAPATPSPQPASPQAEVMATLTQLATLRDHGAITPDEYETKKAELLARI